MTVMGSVAGMSCGEGAATTVVRVSGGHMLDLVAEVTMKYDAVDLAVAMKELVNKNKIFYRRQE